jgi:hypothetical protein
LQLLGRWKPRHSVRNATQIRLCLGVVEVQRSVLQGEQERNLGSFRNAPVHNGSELRKRRSVHLELQNRENVKRGRHLRFRGGRIHQKVEQKLAKVITIDVAAFKLIVSLVQIMKLLEKWSDCIGCGLQHLEVHRLGRSFCVQ